MPSVNFHVLWPDGQSVTYYSPSTIVYEHFTAGALYSQEEFASRTRAALDEASERVYKKFGYYCTAAMAEQEKIDGKLRQLREGQVSGTVQLKGFS